jgi:hypothetical protein
MLENTLLPFSLSSVQRKKVTAAFDGGRMTSDGGVMLLFATEARLGIAARLASHVVNRRQDPTFEVRDKRDSFLVTVTPDEHFTGSLEFGLHGSMTFCLPDWSGSALHRL